MLKVENLSLSYGGNTVLRNICFTLAKGENGCLIGPSGSGKSSILRAIAGFESLQSGLLYLDEKQVNSATATTPPEHRKVGMLFQDLALFPHLTVEKNIAFGLAGLTKSNIKERVAELLELVGLSGFNGRYCHQLSGGQRQRVALARALAPNPDLLLLDEPFSSLDAELRRELVADVYRIFKEKKITTLMVTHDQAEAFSLGDKLGVLIDGELAQWSSPLRVYSAPSSKAVADFVGFGCYIEGVLDNRGMLNTAAGSTCYQQNKNIGVGESRQVLVRPENILFNDNSPIKARVVNRLFRGADSLLTLKLSNGEELLLPFANVNNVVVGQVVGIEMTDQAVVVF